MKFEERGKIEADEAKAESKSMEKKWQEWNDRDMKQYEASLRGCSGMHEQIINSTALLWPLELQMEQVRQTQAPAERAERGVVYDRVNATEQQRRETWRRFIHAWNGADTIRAINWYFKESNRQQCFTVQALNPAICHQLNSPFELAEKV